MAYRARVLVVDDSPTFRHAARLLLSARGFAVVGEAACAETALQDVARLSPDGVLLDLRLGQDDGVEVAARIRSLDPTVSVVLTSVDTVDDEDALVARCGARAFVNKLGLLRADLRVWPPPSG